MLSSNAHILNRVASGEISADEGIRLLRQPPAPAAEGRPARWLHVRVTDLHTGRQKVNVNVPLSWVEAGLRLGGRYHTQIDGLDLADLWEQVQSGATGQLVEVEDLEDGERVVIFVD